MNKEETKTILLVEDEAIIAMAQAQTIKAFGYEVITVHTGDKAVQAVADNMNISMVLMDVDLGSGIDGTEAARQILAFRDIPIVFLTSHSEKEYVERVKEITRYGYVIKESGDFVLRSSIEMAFELFDAHQKMSEEIEERKRVEEELKEIFDCFEKLVKESFDGIVIMENGVVVEANGTFESLYGYKSTELIGMKAIDFIAPESRDLVRDNIMSGYDKSYEAIVLRKDGAKFQVEACGTAVTRNGRPARLTAMRDITERKRAEEALLESEEKWRSMIENTPDYILIVDSNGTIKDINRVMPGFIKKEVIGKTIYDYLPVEFQVKNRKLFKQVFKSGQTKSLEARGTGPNDTISWYETRIIPVIKDSQVTLAILVTTDITERKKVEEDLKESEAKYSALVERANEGIAIAHNERIVFSNEALALMTGYSLSELKGKAFMELMTLESAEYSVGLYRNRVSGETVPSHYQVTGLCKDGTTKEVEISAGTIPYLGDTASIAIIRDITERKKSEKALHEAQQQLQSVVEAALLILWSIDTNGTVTLSVGHGLFALGLQPGELVGRSVYDVYQDSPEALDAIHRGLAGEDFTTDVEVGGRVWNNRYVCRRNEQGDVIGLIGISMDITERKLAEQAHQKS